MAKNNNKAPIEPQAGDNVTQPLTPEEKAERDDEARKDEALKPEVTVAGAVPKKATLKLSGDKAKKSGDKTKKSVDTNSENGTASPAHTPATHPISEKLTGLFEEVRNTCTEHYNIAKSNGHHAVAAVFQNLRHMVNQAENTIKKKNYEVPALPPQVFKSNDSPASGTAQSNSSVAPQAAGNG